MAVIPSSRLSWRAAGDGFVCHLGGRGPLLRLMPDQTYPDMWRIVFPDGRVSDMTNLTRAKDAGLSHAIAYVRKGAAAPPVRPADVPATSHQNARAAVFHAGGVEVVRPA
jgi:hypothetical protein